MHTLSSTSSCAFILSVFYWNPKMYPILQNCINILGGWVWPQMWPATQSITTRTYSCIFADSIKMLFISCLKIPSYWCSPYPIKMVLTICLLVTAGPAIWRGSSSWQVVWTTEGVGRRPLDRLPASLGWATWLGGGCHEQGAVARAVHHWAVGGRYGASRIRGRHVAKVRLLYHHHSWSEFHE